MDWRMIWAITTATPSEIIILLLVLSTIATYFIYTSYETGLYVTSIAFSMMILSGIGGHIYFSINGIFFSHDISRSAVIGATLAMTACFVIAVIVMRLLSDTVYSRYSSVRKSQTPAPVIRRNV